MSEQELEEATEAKDKRVALLIAFLALFLALAEAGAKNAEHRSTEQNIEASDLFNFYQARKIRQTVIDASAKYKFTERAFPASELMSDAAAR